MSERARLQPAPGLARASVIPPPPARRPDPSPRPPVVATAAAAKTSAPRDQPSRVRPRSVGMRPVALSMPAALVADLKERARRDGISQPEVILDALRATSDQLGEFLAEREDRPASDGMFLRLPARRGNAEPTATLSIRLLAPNIAAIDALVDRHGAPSRSRLCAVDLQHYLHGS